MKNDVLVASVPADKVFFIAKAVLPWHKVKFRVLKKSGCSVKKIENNLNIPVIQDVNTDAVHDNNTTKEIFWIPQNNRFYIMNVPWGFRQTVSDKLYAVHGTVKLRIDVEALLKSAASGNLPWQHEYRNGIRYEYLIEHFIDQEHQHNGLSIVFRDELIPLLKDYLYQGTNVRDLRDYLMSFDFEDFYPNVPIQRNAMKADMIEVELTEIGDE